MKKMKFVEEKEKRDQYTLLLWQEHGITYYSEQDLKDAIADRLSTNYCFHDWLKDVVKNVSRRCGRKKCFCDVGGIIYFNSTGLEKIIEYLVKHGFLRPEKCK